MTIPYGRELEIAKRVAVKTGNYLKRNIGKVSIESYKTNFANIVSRQDKEADVIGISELLSTFPNDFILSEESVAQGELPFRKWVFDSCDGTRNYSKGNPYYCISLALVEGDKVKVGVVYAPSYNNELYYSVEGRGAFLNGKKISVKLQTNIKDCVIATGFSYIRDKRLDYLLRIYGRILRSSRDILRFGSAALDMCQVACGRLDAYYEPDLKPWDLASGKLILKEAGGFSSNFDNQELDLFRKSKGNYNVDVIAASSLEILNQLKSIFVSI